MRGILLCIVGVGCDARVAKGRVFRCSLMRKILFSLVGVGLMATVVGAGVFEMDPKHTEVSFAVRHMEISLVRGTFDEFAGSLEYRPEDMQVIGGSITIQVASVNTRIARRDADLCSPKFLDAKTYPIITFESTRFEKKDDEYKLYGNLTIRGITHEIALNAEVFGPVVMDETGHSRLGFQGVATIDRRDWGLMYDEKVFGGEAVIGNEVTLRITTEGAVDQVHRGAYR